MKFLPLTVISDSSDSLISPRKMLLRVDLVASVVDVTSAGYVMGAITSITTTEPQDFINDDDEVGGVVHGVRTIAVQESIETVRSLLEKAA
ncbi:MAG: hypothetical protein Q7U28_09165 [Aquabacterium sp.]|nr:hypothetical protein [Aquabacterium sp.]